MPLTIVTGLTEGSDILGDAYDMTEYLGLSWVYPSGGSSSALPTQAIDFESSSDQSLSMTNANFGAYDHAKFAVSVWVKRESTGAGDFVIMRQFGADRAFLIQFEGDVLAFYTYKSDNNTQGGLNTTATYTNTGVWYHLLLWYDSANATANNRMRIWVNGTEVTVFSFRLNPTAAAASATADVNISSTTSTNDFDGLVYQLAFFSGALPDISTVYNAGSPLSVTGLTGLYSYLDVAGGVVTHDGVLATAWTNNNTAIASSTIPT